MLATILILNGEVNTTALIEGRKKRVGVGLGSFNGRARPLCVGIIITKTIYF